MYLPTVFPWEVFCVFERFEKMMKKIMRVLSYILVAVLAAVVTAVACFRYMAKDYKLKTLEELITMVFVEDVDINLLEDAAADAMVEATGDRWSYYIPASYTDVLAETENNAYVGVGISIAAREDDGYYDIVEIVADGPAEGAGVQCDDVLTGVDGRDIEGMPIEEVKRLVRGKEGTEVLLNLRRAGNELALTMKRKSFETPVAIYQMADEQTGYLLIKNFDRRSAADSIAAIEEMLGQGMGRLIVDLRYNPGGSAEELVKLLDYFLPEGEIFHTVDFRGEEEFFQSDENCLDIPVAVIVNKDSYSAAEFFAGALQEYGRAVVLGEHTSGKGYFQYTYPLGDGSMVALSSGRYFMPSGKSLIGEGLEPDIEAVLSEEDNYYFYYGRLPLEEDSVVKMALEAMAQP